MIKRFRRVSSRTVMTAALAAALPVLAMPGAAKACSGDGSQFIGSICVVAFNFCPRDYAPATGGLVSINENPALFSLIGTTFGGDGRTTFGLPDLRGRMPIGVGTGIGLDTILWGEMRGMEERQIAIAQMPSHTHNATAVFTPNGGGGGGVEVKVSGADGQRATAQAGDFLGAPNAPTMGGAPVNLYTSTETSPVNLGGVSGGGGTGGTVTVTNQNTGGATPLATTDPSLGMTYCIATNGIFPQRP